MDTSTDAQAPVAEQKAPAPETNGAAAGQKAANGHGRAARNINFPVQLRINITPAMNASLGRLAKHLMLPEGAVGRMALRQYLAHQDPNYKE